MKPGRKDVRPEHQPGRPPVVEHPEGSAGVEEIAGELRHIEESLESLVRLVSAIASAVPGVELTRQGEPRKKPRFSESSRAQLRLQGRYLFTLRSLPPEERERIKALRSEKGFTVALDAATTSLKSSSHNAGEGKAPAIAVRDQRVRRERTERDRVGRGSH